MACLALQFIIWQRVCVRVYRSEHTHARVCVQWMAQITWSLLPFHCGFTKALIFCHLARGRARLGTGPHGQLEWKWYGSGKLQCCFRTERRVKSLGAPLPDQPKRRNVKLRERMNLCQVNPSEKPGLRRLLFLIWIFIFFLLEVTQTKAQLSRWSFLKQPRMQVIRDRQASYLS